MDRDQLAEHLRFAAELGVAGVSRDPAWRARVASSGAPASRVAVAGCAPGHADRSGRGAGGGPRRHRRLHALQAAHARPARRSSSASAIRNADLMFVGEAPGPRRRHPGHPVRRPRRTAAHEDHRGDRPHARGRLHRQRHQVPPAAEPQSRAGRSRDVRAVPVPADRHHQAEGHRRARQVRRADAAADARPDLAPARPRLRLPRREADSHVPSRLPAAQPVLEARGVGRHEAGQNPA